ncbi:YeiH family protein, partial [Campylobacter lari]|uniref:YeiH family protein n=1 Tax=Campylobacter lari TaxID=201 RepID=UPI00214A20F4
QACIITIITFFSIFFIATKIFKLDPRFGVTLGGGGSICGVSAAIVIGNAAKAKQEYISATISIVVFWAVLMILFLPALCKFLNLDPGVAGAWIGTSEFADAAGIAAAAAIGDERAIAAFTLIKVLGRDMFIGIWAVLVAFLSITFWEKKDNKKTDIKLIWQRFPIFIAGFIFMSIFTTIVIVFLQEHGQIYQDEVLSSIKNFRNWIFTWTFLCIGLSANIKQILSLGYKPLMAFSLGVMINLPLGFILSNYIFVEFWTNFLK